MERWPTVDLPRLELICFGPPHARVNGAQPPPDVLWRKHLALLIYLALSPDHARSRDHLLGLLWPEKAQHKARHSLNEAVRRLRTGLGAGRLLTQGDVVALSEGALEVDAVRFTQLADRDARAAIAMLRGDFLEGFSLDDAPSFEDWASDRRRHFRAWGASLLVQEAEGALAANRFGAARDAAGEALRLIPVLEPAVTVQVRAAALAGDAAGALTAYHDFSRRLANDIGEAPSRELSALAERVRTGWWRRVSHRHKEPEPPLIGRSLAHATVFTLVDSGLKGGARAILITGDPGLGKSRLLSECVNRLALAGATTAVARPLESDHDAPWSTLRQLLRGGLADAPGLAAADPESLGVLAFLAPELADRFAPSEPRDTGHVVAALSGLLAAVAEERPVAIAIDDAHFADGSTVGGLGAAIRQLGPAPVTLVIAADRAAESLSREVVLLRGDVGRRIPGTSIELAPLGEKEIRELVTSLAHWCERPDEVDRLARRVYFETQGNPFLAVTLLLDLERTTSLQEDVLVWPTPRATYETPLPSIPHLVKTGILARVSSLDEESRKVISAASVGGVALDPPLIAALAETTADRVEELLERLEQHRFVTYNGDRYAFAAPLERQVVRAECLTAGQRQRLRKRAIAELASRPDLESRVLRAELMAQGEGGGDAVFEAVTVAKAAVAAGSERTARRALFAAEQAARASGQPIPLIVSELRTALDEKQSGAGDPPSPRPATGRSPRGS